MAFIGANTSTNAIPAVAAWSSGTTYTPGQVVSNNGQNWIATLVKRTNTDSNSSNVGQVTTITNVGQTPVTGSEFWSAYTGPCWVTSSKTFTSDSLLAMTHDKFTGSVYSTETGSGAGGKLYIDQSGDNVWTAGTFVSNYTKGGDYSVTDGTPLGFSEEIILPYIRVRYVYTTTQPTTFKLFGRTADSGVKY